MSTICNCTLAIKFPESVNVWPTFVAKCCCFGLKENKRVFNASFPHQPYQTHQTLMFQKLKRIMWIMTSRVLIFQL